MTPPFDRAEAASAEIKKAGRFINADWHRHHDVIASPDLVRAHEMHMSGLRHGWMILDAASDMPADVLACLHELHSKNPSAFNAIVNLARQELDRANAPAQEKAA